MFPAEMLAPATSLCVAANWVFNFLVGISFQSLEVHTVIGSFVCGLSYFVDFVSLVLYCWLDYRVSTASTQLLRLPRLSCDWRVGGRVCVEVCS
jgi:hypothetical protein